MSGVEAGVVAWIGIGIDDGGVKRRRGEFFAC
jgi:hypothetical protein